MIGATSSMTYGCGGAPIAWKPPSTCRISPLIARARSDSRKQTASATGRRVGRVPPERRLLAPQAGELVEAGDALGRGRLDRSGGHEVHPHARRGRGRAPGSGTPTRARPSPRPSSRRPARPPRRRSPCPTNEPPSSPISGARAPASALNEYAQVRKAISADSAGALMKLPPSASPGAKAIACRAPSRPAPAEPSSRGDGGQVVGRVHVQLEHVRRRRQPRGGPLGHALGAAEAGQHDLGALLLGPLGHRVGDRAAREHARDEQSLALEQHD